VAVQKGLRSCAEISRSAVRLRSASSEALLLPDRLGGYFLQGDGSLLATGSYDGQARVWTKDGEQQSSSALIVIAAHGSRRLVFLVFPFPVFLTGRPLGSLHRSCYRFLS
jgi:hypothetical protein